MVFYKANKVGDYKIEHCDHQITSDIDKFAETFASVLSQSLKPIGTAIPPRLCMSSLFNQNRCDIWMPSLTHAHPADRRVLSRPALTLACGWVGVVASGLHRVQRGAQPGAGPRHAAIAVRVVRRRLVHFHRHAPALRRARSAGAAPRGPLQGRPRRAHHQLRAGETAAPPAA